MRFTIGYASGMSMSTAPAIPNTAPTPLPAKRGRAVDEEAEPGQQQDAEDAGEDDAFTFLHGYASTAMSPFGLCLAGENDAVGLVVRIESVLDRHLDLAGSHLHLAHAAGADAAREFDSDAELLGELQNGV